MKTRCEKCGATYVVADRFKGHRGRCEKCGAVFRLKDLSCWLAALTIAMREDRQDETLPTLAPSENSTAQEQ